MEKSFSSKLGVLLASAGSAVGLGSIWKFPYVVGENGGGAFILLYVACSLLFGLPLVMNEFLIGKLSGRSAYSAYRVVSTSSHWQWLSWINLLCVIVIMGFYFVVTGWCFYYMVEAASNTFAGMDAEALTTHFNAFSRHSPVMLIYASIAIVLTASVLWFDVNKGIERLSKILMPVLFIILILMAAHMIFLDGGYMPKDQKVTSTSVQMIVLVLIVSLLAGMIVFPAVFAYGFSPAEGPELTFVTLPAVFQQMFTPALTCTVFFGLMCVAAITSTISMMEVMVAFFCDATAGR